MHPSPREVGVSAVRQLRRAGRRSTDLTRRELHALDEQMLREHQLVHSAGTVIRAVRRVLAEARQRRPRPSRAELADLIRAALREPKEPPPR